MAAAINKHSLKTKTDT